MFLEGLTNSTAWLRFSEILGVKKITKTENARELLGEISLFFYFVAACFLLNTFYVNWIFFSDSVLFLILAFSIQRYSSRFSSLMLVLMSLMMVFDTFSNIVEDAGTGKNYVFALLALFFSLRSTQLTLFVHRETHTNFSIRNFMVKAFGSVVLFSVFLLLGNLVSTFLISDHRLFPAEQWLVFLGLCFVGSVFLCFGEWIPWTRGMPVCVQRMIPEQGTASETVSVGQRAEFTETRDEEAWKGCGWEEIAGDYRKVLNMKMKSFLAAPQSLLPFPERVIKTAILEGIRNTDSRIAQRRVLESSFLLLAHFVPDSDARFIEQLERRFGAGTGPHAELNVSDKDGSVDLDAGSILRVDEILAHIEGKRRQNSEALQSSVVVVP